MNPISRPTPPSTAAPTGPEQLCAAWYAAHGVAIYNYFRLQLASPDDADDLTAETFLRAVRHAHRYDPDRASAGTWLATIARRVLIDHLRSARVRRSVALDEMRDLVDDAPSPEERMLRRDEVARALRAMATLDVADRELLALRFGVELEIPEIAESFGVRAGTVRTRLWRALDRLRERLR